ncbi:ABC transporter permease [Anditalea andensis]|uniref:ABC transporter permease n=1 Tax=Anditalea andensis TaxID=1048983 RepID=A0A074KYS7_9BACT|nr:DUF3526 domain-containing protein [Anditalea andensis]KEO74089.1 hypothetical protein EL17_08060 [Anditalea andensis]
MEKILIIAKNEWKILARNKIAVFLIMVFSGILLLAAYVGLDLTSKQNEVRQKYQLEVQDQWMSQPDRHPHRVAHYGYLAFREKSALSFFDFGIESFVGNSVFLEAHRQNTVNLSEAGFSNGMLRFGELSMAMVLQLLTPLFIFFIGFSTVASLRENGILKIMLTQGISMKTIVWGKIVGVFSFTAAVFLPLILIGFIGELLWNSQSVSTDIFIRGGTILLLYAVYFGICSSTAVLVSAHSKKAGHALISLILIWMFSAVIMPKMAQTIGTKLYPSISKLEFEREIEADLSQEGDSHNPDDPHYAAFKAATLAEYGVDSVHKLPFNYSGYVMAEGERISASLFNRHFDRLIHTYQNQNSFAEILSFINPYLMIRNASILVAGTDLEHYVDFQKQAEAYRYQQTQWLNHIHTYEIKAQNDKAQRVQNDLFKEYDTFSYQSRSISWAAENKALTVASLIFWISLLLGTTSFLANKSSAI